MAKFIINATNSINGEQQGKGWVSVFNTYNQERVISEIEDKTISNKGKIGTSIPTPLARIELFDTAFNILIQGRNNGREVDPSYKRLASECLDLLQFVFEKGTGNSDYGDLTVEQWNIQDEITHLANSSNVEGHKLLGEALRVAVGQKERDPSGNLYGQLGDMFIFSYKGIVLGGYSPHTVVYTSPNVNEHIRQSKMELDFYGEDGHRLFNNLASPRLIEERSESFQTYLRALINTLPNTSFRQYIIAMLGTPDERFGRLLGRQFQPVPNTKNLLYYNASVDTKNSGLVIVPNGEVTYYRQFTGSAEPLVLCEDKGTSYIYLSDAWKSGTHVKPNGLQDGIKSIAKRRLPTNGTYVLSNKSYPYLWINDFLEEAIVNIDYDIDSTQFVSCADYSNDPVDNRLKRFLIPIRKEYFLFFTLKDLEKHLTCEIKDHEIKVTLNIPVTGNNNEGGTVGFERIYGTKYYPILRFMTDRESMMTLTIFPSYRIKEGGVGNRYIVQLCLSEGGSESLIVSDKVTFMEFGQIEQKAAAAQKRTKDSNASSFYYHLGSDSQPAVFDFILLDVKKNGETFNTILIPKWTKEVSVTANNEYTFGIDFGTSNTHIAYSNDTGQKPKPLEIKEQVLKLGVNKSGYLPTDKRFDREFIPSKALSYPIKTSSLETPSFKLESELFSQWNIGYSLEEEMYTLDSSLYRYMTDLKWDYQKNIENKLAKRRIELYCNQTIWMIRNQVLQNGGGKKIKLFYFTPSVMSDDLKGAFQEAWNDAVKKILKGFDYQISKIDEAVAPYYALVTGHYGTTITESDNIVNIDIGGGTTDIFYFKCRDTKAKTGYIASSMFAGNDIWGNGVRNIAGIKNGFVKCALDKLEADGNTPESHKILLENCKRFSSADASSLLFKHDEELDYSIILRNPKTRLGSTVLEVLLVHYASLIYYLVDLLRKYQLDIPDCISFTGKGSEYIKLFAYDITRIEKITKALLKTFMGSECSDAIDKIIIKRVENPKEITATGGVLYDQVVGHSEITLFDENPIYTLGTGDDESETYKNREIIENKALKERVINNFCKFISQLYESEWLKNALRGSGFSFSENERVNSKKWKEFGVKSYEHTIRLHQEETKTSEDEEITSSLFFFTLKDAIFQMTQQLIDDES